MLFGNTNHLVQATEKKKCAGDGYKTKTSIVQTQCEEWEVKLCFEDFQKMNKMVKFSGDIQTS